MLKYDRGDARDLLERASARETTARVAAAAVCRRLLEEFGVRIGSHVVHLGGVDAARPEMLPDDLNAVVDGSPLRTLDPVAEREMIARIDAAKKAGDTLGGICEVIVTGLPVGLQLIAARGREELLFSLGAAFQRETNWHEVRPD